MTIAAPLTPFEKRKQLSNALMELASYEIPALKSVTGIERQLMESFIQATLVQYGHYINEILGISRD